MEPITVVIPVGPGPAYKKYLPECVESVLNQTHKPDEIVFIDDGAHLKIDEIFRLCKESGYGSDYYYEKHYNQFNHSTRGCSSVENLNAVFNSSFCDWWGNTPEAKPNHEMFVKYYRTLWNVGVPDAFNFGIALAKNNLVFTFGSDDIMHPTCLEECAKAYDEHKIEGWYTVTIETQSGEESWIPNNTAMVTKKLWDWVGGFPPSAGIGGCDALVLSILMVHAEERIILVKQDTPLCWLREGDWQDTRKSAAHFHGEVLSVRNKETNRWKPKEI